MSDSVERSTCPKCGRPIFRYVIIRARKSPLEPETSSTWWCHEDEQTFACEQPGATDA